MVMIADDRSAKPDEVLFVSEVPLLANRHLRDVGARLSELRDGRLQTSPC
jgi:hypothetical protein